MTFFRGSRYEKVGEVVTDDPSGRTIRYKRSRFIPEVTAARGRVVRDGDRLDLVAWDEYRDPERFWLLCDAGAVMWPPDLLADPGEVIGIPDPEDAP
jgi:hypothetical protein